MRLQMGNYGNFGLPLFLRKKPSTLTLILPLVPRKRVLALPFVIIDKATDEIIGSTRYMNVETPHRRLEIGSTWYAKRTQRTGINTESKYLLLKHAFETLNAIAVEFRTHFHNHPSRNAILRLGAKQDGILRNHRIDDQGNYRDTVVFFHFGKRMANDKVFA